MTTKDLQQPAAPAKPNRHKAGAPPANPSAQKTNVAQTAGFLLHDGVGIGATADTSRSAVAEQRLALTEHSDV